MTLDTSTLLSEYKSYCELFWKCIMTEEVYLEVTAGAQDYKNYQELCANRLYTFRDWATHTYGETALQSLAVGDDKY